MVELFHRLDQAQVAFLNQVQELHAAPHIPLGDGNHQTQVGFAQTLLGLLPFRPAGLDLQGQVNLFLRSQQRHTTDLLEVDLDGVVDGNAVGIQAVLKIVHIVFGQRCIPHVHRVVIHDLDAAVFQFFIELFHLLHVEHMTAFLHRISDFAAG